MLSRRQFCSVLFGLPALAIAPQLNLAPGATEILAGAPPEIAAKIFQLEQALAMNNGVFSLSLHNELRHHYLAYSEEMSRKHADIIFAHCLMDDYTLNTLSDWQFGGETWNKGNGIVKLLEIAKRYGNFVHLKAACLIKAGDVYRELQLHSHAVPLYREILNTGLYVTTMQPYHHLAQLRLS
jgi:hypothetical protein